MTFATHLTYRVDAEGRIERTGGQLPSVICFPTLSVTVAPTASNQASARLSRRLADDLEGQPYEPGG